jgi:hypothetical protein
MPELAYSVSQPNVAVQYGQNDGMTKKSGVEPA